MTLNFEILDSLYAIYRFDTNAQLPDWIYQSEFYSVTKTRDEISVVTSQQIIETHDVKSSNNWRILKIIGPLDFSLVGIIADIAGILKREQISIFTISTYDTDYIHVKENNLEKAVKALKERGHKFITD